jgi:hypothetical protein
VAALGQVQRHGLDGAVGVGVMCPTLGG